MRSQTLRGSARIVERVRAAGSLQVSNGVDFEVELARALDMPEFTSAELFEAVEHLESIGTLHRFNWFEAVGNSGATRCVAIFRVN